MNDLKIAIIMLGPPGAGKGTQARLLSGTFNFAHISTGDMLRMAIKDGTENGIQAKTFIESGQLVPNELVDAIVNERLRHDDCRRGFILDGYPRTLSQADTLQRILDQENVRTITVCISVTDKVLFVRLGSRWMCPNCNRTFSIELSSGALKGVCDKCDVNLVHRVDDSIDVITARLKVYHEQTEPLLRYYQGRETYVPVDGDQAPAIVFYAIRGAVEKRMNSASVKKVE